MGVARGWEDCGDGTEKRGGETDFQKEGQTGSRGGCLKKEGWVEPPYELWVIVQHSGIFLVLNLMKWDKKNPLFCILKI